MGGVLVLGAASAVTRTGVVEIKYGGEARLNQKLFSTQSTDIFLQKGDSDMAKKNRYFEVLGGFKSFAEKF